MTSEQITEVAFAIYREFARIPDPEYARKRWARLRRPIKEQYCREAQAAIQAYRAVTEGNRK